MPTASLPAADPPGSALPAISPMVIPPTDVPPVGVPPVGVPPVGVPPTASIIRELLAYGDRPGLLSMAGGLPAPELLPAEEVAAAASAVLLGEGDEETACPRGSRALQYAPTEGISSLREHLAATELGDRAAVAQVLVTSGSQQALDLVARTLEHGATIVVDDPCYVGARQVFGRAATRVHGVPLDADGMRVDLLESRLRSGLRPALVYTVTCHHNPAGVNLAPDRGDRLVELAERYGFLLVEDGAYRDLSFDGERAPVLAARSDRTISLGTVSKIIAPGLRVGWAGGPAEIVNRLALEKQAVDLQSSTLSQALVVALLERPGWLTGHLDRLRVTYRERCDALLGALHGQFGDRIEMERPRGGLFVWARLSGVDTSALLGAALDAGVAFVPGSAFAVHEPADDRVRLSFATLHAPDLFDAVERLGAAVEAMDGRVTGP